MVENGEQNNQLENEESTTADLPVAQNQSTEPSAADTTKHVSDCKRSNPAGILGAVAYMHCGHSACCRRRKF